MNNTADNGVFGQSRTAVDAAVGLIRSVNSRWQRCCCLLKSRALRRHKVALQEPSVLANTQALSGGAGQLDMRHHTQAVFV